MPPQPVRYFQERPPGVMGQGGVQYSGLLKDLSPVLWRLRMRQAAFKGAAFHVESQGRVSGRRTVLHEYPKLDQPYAEDLGRHAVRYQITGYVIQRWQPKVGAPQTLGNMDWNYDMARDRLIAALEDLGPGTLIDPYNNRIGPSQFQCERYAMNETRERGGYAQFEMQFVEAGGSNAFQFVSVDTQSLVTGSANSSMGDVAQILNTELAKLNQPGVPLPQVSSSPSVF